MVKDEQEMTEKENNKKAKSSKKDKGMKKRKRKYKDVQIDNEQKFQDEHASLASDSDQKRVKKKKKKKRWMLSTVVVILCWSTVGLEQGRDETPLQDLREKPWDGYMILEKGLGDEGEGWHLPPENL